MQPLLNRRRKEIGRLTTGLARMLHKERLAPTQKSSVARQGGTLRSRGCYARSHSDSVFVTPRTFMYASTNCNAISAHACADHAHAIHKRLLSIIIQNPLRRRCSLLLATNQAANTVTTIAGHCNDVSESTTATPLPECRLVSHLRPPVGFLPVAYGSYIAWRHGLTAACQHGG